MRKLAIASLPRRPAPSPHPLAAALEASRVTVTSAAKLLGVSRPHLSAVLHGKANTSARLARKMAELTAALVAEQAEGVRRA